MPIRLHLSWKHIVLNSCCRVCVLCCLVRSSDDKIVMSDSHWLVMNTTFPESDAYCWSCVNTDASLEKLRAGASIAFPCREIFIITFGYLAGLWRKAVNIVRDWFWHNGMIGPMQSSLPFVMHRFVLDDEYEIIHAIHFRWGRQWQQHRDVWEDFVMNDFEASLRVIPPMGEAARVWGKV